MTSFNSQAMKTMERERAIVFIRILAYLSGLRSEKIISGLVEYYTSVISISDVQDKYDISASSFSVARRKIQDSYCIISFISAIYINDKFYGEL